MWRARFTARRTRTALVVVVVGVLLAAGIGYLFVPAGASGYRLRLVLPEAAGVFDGLPVRINNIDVGSVTGVTSQDGKAVVDVRIDDNSAPMHEGTKPVVTSRSLVGEQYLQLEPGPAGGPALASGSILATDWSQVQIEDVLEALDAPTRQHLRSLLAQTGSGLAGHENDVNATLRAAGPTVQALGQVLAAVGQDGPAVHELVTNLNQMVSAVASRRADLSSAVSNLTTIAGKVAAHQKDLTAGLAELPSTLRTTRSTLDKIPRAVDAAQPLLTDLQPAVARLPSVAGNLAPLLTDLRPTLDELAPTLRSASSLLNYVPSLLDSSHAVLPGATAALGGLAPALNYLRPYTPDLAGWLANWAGLFGGYNSQGHYGHLLLTESVTAVDNNPGLVPGLTYDRTTAPGTAAGQPWTDANGEPIQ